MEPGNRAVLHLTRATFIALLCLFGGFRADPPALSCDGAESDPASSAPGFPLLSSWFMSHSSRYARVVEQTGASPTATWPTEGLPNRGGGQSKPTYADVQQVAYSADWVYVTGTGLASHQMGPWYIGINRIFGNWPSNQSYIRRFPRHPKPADKKVTNGLGDLGIGSMASPCSTCWMGRTAIRPPNER